MQTYLVANERDACRMAQSLIKNRIAFNATFVKQDQHTVTYFDVQRSHNPDVVAEGLRARLMSPPIQFIVVSE